MYVSGTIVPMLEAVMAVVPVDKLAVHFHDTYGQSLPNIFLSLQVRSPVKILKENRKNISLMSDYPSVRNEIFKNDL